MKLLPLLFLLASSPAFAVTCPTGVTHIVDVLLAGDGVTQAYGKLRISGPTSSSSSVLAITQTISIGSGGVVDFCLVGGVAARYSVSYLFTTPTGRATNDSFTEIWFVPATTSVMTIKKLRIGSGAAQYQVSPQQINPEGLNAGQIWVWDGTSYIGATNAAGGMTDPGANGVMRRSAFNVTGVVPGTPTDCVLVDGTSGPCGPDATGKATGTYCLTVVNGVITGLVACTGGVSTALSWHLLTSGQWAALTSAQWAALTI